MTKKIIIGIIYLLITVNAFAQKITTSKDFNVKLGTPYRVVDAKTKMYQEHNNIIVSVKITKGEVTLQSFDAKTLKQISVNEYNDFEKYDVFEHYGVIGGRFYLFYSEWDRPNKHEQLFAREINPTTAKFKGPGKRFVVTTGKIAGNAYATSSFFTYETRDKFNFQYSKDKSKLLIKYRLVDDGKEAKTSFKVLDSNLGVVWEGDHQLFEPGTEGSYLDFSIDKDGNVYAILEVREITDQKNDYYSRIDIITISAKTERLSRKKIPRTDKIVTSLKLHESSEGHMVCAGYYKDSDTKYGTKGVFIYKIDKNGISLNKYFHEIPMGILNQNVSNKEVKKNTKKAKKGKDVVFSNLYLDEVSISKDGSIVILGEEYFTRTHTSTDANGGYRSYTTYHYNDILATRITPEGKLAWMHKIPKEQTGRVGKGGMSYQYIYSKDAHYVLYLDNIKNLNLPKDKKPYGHSDGAGGFLTGYKINHSTGQSEKISLFDLRDVKGITAYQFTTDRIVQIEGGRFAVEVYKKKKEDVLIGVSINE